MKVQMTKETLNKILDKVAMLKNENRDLRDRLKLQNEMITDYNKRFTRDNTKKD